LEKLSDEALESIIAFYPQSTIGDKVTRIIRQCHTDPDWPVEMLGLHLTFTTLLLLSIALVTVLSFVRIMKKYAEEPLLIEGMDGQIRELIIPCDLKCSVPDAMECIGGQH
jgi:hypothetical protein